MRKLKKVTSVIMAVIMLLSVMTIMPVTASAYANVDGYPDFDVDVYVAGLMTDEDNPLYKTINNQISLDSPNDVVIKQLKEDSVFQASYAGWKLATFSAGDIVSDSLTEVGYYQSLILNVISEALTSTPVEDIFDHTIVKDAKHLQSTFTSTLKLDFVFTDLNDLNIAEMSQDEQIKVMDAFSSSFEKTYPEVSDVGKFVSIFSTIVKEGKNIETAINNLVAYVESVGMTEHMKAVVADLYNNCDSSNVAMKSALFEINKACQSYTLAYSAAIFDLASSSLTLLCGEVVNAMCDGIMAANPAGLSVMIGQAIGKGVANFLFSTDEICEQYHKMCCLYEFEELLGKVTRLEMNSFSNSKTNYNANKIFSAVDFLYKEYEVSCDLAKKYADIIFKESIAGIFVLNSDGYNNYISSVEGMRTTAENNYAFLKGDAWTYFLEEDYPDIYAALMKEEEEIRNPFIPVTGIAFEKSSVEWGTQDSFLNYDKATITPSNASLQSIEYTSSDPSVVSYNKFGAVVHKAGTATITATSVSSGLTATLNVTVVNGYGADGIALEDPNPGATANGKCGDNVYWTLYNDGTLFISGSGEMYGSFQLTDIPWDNFRESINTVIIGSGVTSIGRHAFSECKSLKSITIPDSVTSIAGSAFNGCYNLKSITIPDSVTSIGDWAFWGCSSLESITIPDSVTSIGDYAFLACTRLKNITISDGVMSIGAYAFQSCTSLESITIPDSVTSIGHDAFYNCTSLESITLPDSVTSIFEYTFYNCISLASITIPDSVTSIGNTSFYNCRNLKSITIPDSVTSIGGFAFYDCTSLNSITIPDSVTSIGSSAFENCTSLKNITIPNSVTSIGSRAFENCTSLENINVSSANTLYSSVDGVLFSKDKTELIKYPEGKTAKSYTIPESVTSIGSYAFSRCTNLKNITITDSLTSIS